MAEPTMRTGRGLTAAGGPGSTDPVLELVVDPERLSALLRTPVAVTRVRPKHGVSHVAALVGADGQVLGWAQALIGDARTKGGKARARAERYDLGDQIFSVPLPQWDAELLWGALTTDPALAKALRRSRVDLASDGVRLLRYNPLRRLVVRDGDRVVRITAQPHRERMTRVTQALAGCGIPVLCPTDQQPDSAGRVSVWPWVEGQDLQAAAAQPDDTSAAATSVLRHAREAGAIVRRLHSLPTAAVPRLPRRGWPEVVDSAQRAVAQLQLVAPTLAHPARLALAGLPDEAAGGDPVLLHGDLSLDQVLVAADGSVLLTDLDRAATGPPEVDLAAMAAARIVQEVDADAEGDVEQDRRGSDLLAAFEAGYGRGDSGSDAPWVAAALLGRIAEPWRAQAPLWEERTEALGRVALDLLASGLLARGAQAAHAVDGWAHTAPPARWPGWQVPARVEDPTTGEGMEVARAWPAPERDGTVRVAVEGRDARGRLRAGHLTPGGDVELHPPGQDPRLPALAGAARAGSLLVHRAGRRAVVHRQDGYLKVVRPGRATPLAAGSVDGARLARAAGLEAADVLELTDDTVRYQALRGIPVQRLSADPRWPQIWRTWAAAWTRWQRLDGPEGAEHTPRHEAEVLRTWAARSASLGLLAGTPWPDRIERTAQRLAASGGTPLVPAHRDLHDGQLLWDGSRLAVIDLDTVCRAEPALDLANLEVHARWRGAQGLWSDEAVRTVGDAVAAVVTDNQVDPGRLRLARVATVARLVAVYAFRPRWRDRVIEWADQEWAGGLDG
ncbi:aminoglycoside phosphotransferase family protein [Serinicoccus kebangsaanensis]|uniref:aminoglycoside phosphotransferase family protein n=1 Tax=Serinicoccus kebangsaanensis TaxID=2602069 RepID=UPI00124CE021|nr:aminoglycoside phosphotransferase family protein [Serinicoccus kebangsaanensis]